MQCTKTVPQCSHTLHQGTGQYTGTVHWDSTGDIALAQDSAAGQRSQAVP